MRLVICLLVFLLPATAAQSADFPSDDKVYALCSWFAEQASMNNAPRLVVQTGQLPIQNDGVIHDFDVVRQGSMGVDWVRSDQKINEKTIPVRFEQDVRWQHGIGYLPLGQRVYQIRYRNNLSYEYPSYLLYPTPQGNHVLCQFDVLAERSVPLPIAHDENSLEVSRRVCQAFDEGEISSIVFRAFAHPEKRLAEHSPTNEISLDYDNDGLTEKLYRLTGNSGAGRGCDSQIMIDQNCFEAAFELGKADCFDQPIAPASSIPCRDQNINWFSFEGTTYLHLQGTTPPTD